MAGVIEENSKLGCGFELGTVGVVVEDGVIVNTSNKISLSLTREY
jgi:hypothetical protein